MYELGERDRIPMKRKCKREREKQEMLKLFRDNFARNLCIFYSKEREREINSEK